MKNKSKPREYKFSTTKDGKIAMSYRFGLNYEIGEMWCFHGLVSPFISAPIDAKDHSDIQKIRNQKHK